MKEFKRILNTDKSKKLELDNIYTIMCGNKMLKKDKALKQKLKILLNVEDILSIKKANYYSKGYIKLYVKTKYKLDWL